jgi:hypothetical protein
MSVLPHPPPFEIRKTGLKLPSCVAVHGTEGTGKTGFAAQFPKPFFILSARETGLEALMDSGQLGEIPHTPPLTTWRAVTEVVEWVHSGDHDYRTLVIDVVSGIAREYLDDVVSREFDGKAGLFSAFGADKKYHYRGWETFLTSLHSIREKRRMGIILLSHTGVERFNNPEGNDYDRYTPRIAKPIWERTFAWADVVLFMNSQTVALRPEKGNDRDLVKTKGKDLGGRMMYTTRTAAWDAKNRHNLPTEIPMGDSAVEAFANFSSAMREARQANAPQSAATVGNAALAAAQG